MTGLASYQEDNTSILSKPNLDDLVFHELDYIVLMALSCPLSLRSAKPDSSLLSITSIYLPSLFEADFQGRKRNIPWVQIHQDVQNQGYRQEASIQGIPSPYINH